MYKGNGCFKPNQKVFVNGFQFLEEEYLIHLFVFAWCFSLYLHGIKMICRLRSPPCLLWNMINISYLSEDLKSNASVVRFSKSIGSLDRMHLLHVFRDSCWHPYQLCSHTPQHVPNSNVLLSSCILLQVATTSHPSPVFRMPMTCRDVVVSLHQKNTR